MLRLIPRLSELNPAPLIEAGLPLPLARVLWARGVYTAEAARAFLQPNLSQLEDPMGLSGMAEAVARVRRALDNQEKIIVYGDYDVDGVCATAILVEALRAHGGQADWYIPSRHREGYGLNPDAVRTLAGQCALLITVDCGITSVAEAELAIELGLDLRLTDHHEPPPRLPRAVALVNPLLGEYPFRRLCGAGVALKLAQALFGFEAIEPLIELAALATVADMVPLLGENRVLVHHGLKQWQHTERPGLKALLAVSGLSGKALTAGHLSFQIAPRINAGGRLTEASRNVTLLLTDDPAEAQAIATDLDVENTHRQQMERAILQEADQYTREHVDFLHDRAIVVAGQGWNHGVVGLVASRLTEQYGWPSVVLTETDGVLVGSARSIPGVNLHAALSQCADLFLRFGGHAQAAGMTLKAERLPEFRQRIHEAIAAVAEPDAFIPSAAYDLDITLPEISIPLVEQLSRLAPTGIGNPAPICRLTDARLLEAREVGAQGRHLKLKLMQGGAVLDGIAFGQGAKRAELPERVDALFTPTINEFMGRRSAQCEVARLLPHQAAEAFLLECAHRADDFDHALCYPPDGLTPAPTEAQIAEALRESAQGTLLTVRTTAGAARWVRWLQKEGLADRLSYCFGAPGDVRRFNALCALSDADAPEGFLRVFPLDDADIPAARAAWLPTDDMLRGLYRILRDAVGGFVSETALAEKAGMRPAAVRLGLVAFAELKLLSYQPAPFQALLLPPVRCDLADSTALRRARQMLGEVGE
ncbi:MAG: single-stranded-DNA-specific exonuclease RecJ [Oscillospiraceae bacterium]|jgi:single-stranded-DNA-specific exonuclease|nr:single-stranded-DNA-specific exonuclease RecJ [Oscillospiraceae bacterium]